MQQLFAALDVDVPLAQLARENMGIPSWGGLSICGVGTFFCVGYGVPEERHTHMGSHSEASSMADDLCWSNVCLALASVRWAALDRATWA